MKKLITCFLLAFVLASCNQGAGDGYTFEKGTQRIAERPIKVVTYGSYADLRRAYATFHEGRQLSQNEELQAFSVINGVCTIHMIDPAVNYQPDFFGHELTHCLYGDFHPHQNDR
jgi:predicted small secreted protein